MFFCEECRVANDWPGIRLASRGKCEVCEKVADCYDVPSSYLPTPRRPKPTPKERRLAQLEDADRRTSRQVNAAYERLQKAQAAYDKAVARLVAISDERFELNKEDA